MRTGKINKLISVLLVLVMTVGLFTQLPGVTRSFAEGATGADLTDQMALTVNVESSSDGATYSPLSQSEATTIAEGHYLRFLYRLHKEQDYPINDGDFFRLPVSSVYANLEKSELQELESLLQNGSSGSFEAKFDDYDNPSHIKLTFKKAYAQAEEAIFNIAAVIQMHFEQFTIDKPYILTVPLTGGASVTFPLAVEIPSGYSSAIKVSGVRLPIPEIHWTVDVNTNLSSDYDYLVVRNKLPQGLLLDDLIVVPLELGYDASHNFYVNEGAPYSQHTGGGEPSGTSYKFEVQGDEFLFKIPNPKNSDGYRKAFRIKMKSLEDPSMLQPWLDEIVYKNVAGVYADESAVSADSTAEAVVTYNPGHMLIKTGTTGTDQTGKEFMNVRELTWTVTINPEKFPLQDVSLMDAIRPVGDAYQDRWMSFDLADMELRVTDAAGTESTVALKDAPTPGDSWVEFQNEGRDFVLHFDDAHISGKTAVLTVVSRIAEDRLKFAIENHGAVTVKVSYKNKASLNYGGLPKPIVSEDIRSIHYGKYIAKNYSTSIGYGENKFIDWRLYFNLGNLTTDISEIYDEIDDTNQHLILTSGGELDTSKIQVEYGYTDFNVRPDGKTEVVWKRESRLNYGTDFTVEQVGDNKIVVRLLGAHAPNRKGILIRLRTKINPAAYEDPVAQDYGNTAIIGPDSYFFGRKSTIVSTFKKTAGEFSYADGSIAYTLSADPKQKPLDQLVIHDRLPSGIVVTGANLKTMMETGTVTSVRKSGKDVITPLVHGTDFTVSALPKGAADLGSNYVSVDPGTVAPDAEYSSFKVEYLNQVGNALYLVNFKGTLDRDQFVVSDKYINVAEYSWAGAPTPAIAQAETAITDPLMKQNGSMSGQLLLSQKRLQWQIDFNYLALNTNNVEVKTEVGLGHAIDPGSIRIYKDAVNPDGTLKPTGAGTLVDLDAAGITIEMGPDDKSFVAKFHPGTGVTPLTEPYRIVYQTDMFGLALPEYEAESLISFIDVTGTPHALPLRADTVKHDDSNKYISKSGVSTSSSPMTNWTIVLNQAYSDIYSLTITDTFTPGLEPVKESFRLFDANDTLVAQGDEFFDNWFEYIPPQGPQNQERSFKLVFREDLANQRKISEMMKIRYDMRLVKEFLVSNNLTNTVSLDGELGNQAITQEQTTIQQKYYTISVDETNINRKLVVVKFGEDDDGLGGVKFRLDLVTPGAAPVTVAYGETDAGGTVEFNNLRKNTMYRVVETKSADGYWIAVPDYQEILITDQNNVLGGGSPAILKFVNNMKRTIKVVKRDAQTNELMPGVTFELRDSNNDVVLATAETDSEGVARFDANIGVYWLREVTPDGYYPALPIEILISDNDMESIGGRLVKKLQYEFEFVNQPKRVVEIHKIDPEGRPVKGTEFAVTDPQGRVEKMTTDENGKITFKAELGEYRFVETKAAPGFKLNPEPFSITVSLYADNSNDYQYVFTKRVVNVKEDDIPQPSVPATEPTTAPTTEPTTAPTTEPTTAPTTEPTTAPTTEPTTAPTTEPTTAPTTEPTTTTEPPTTIDGPTAAPITTEPTTEPTTAPTVAPTAAPPTTTTTEGAFGWGGVIEPPAGTSPTRKTTETLRERTTGVISGGSDSTVTITRPPTGGTLTIRDGEWEYIPLGAPTRDSFVVMIRKTDGTTETLEVDIVPEDTPRGSLPATGQLPEWMFYLGGAAIVSIGVLIRRFTKRPGGGEAA